jgi:site-specific DNA-cytosine methylase
LKPSEIENDQYHIQDDVLNHLEGWDLMIAHPDCTYLSYAGTRHWNNDGRYKLRLEAINFFMKFVNAPIDKICIENPFGIMEQVYRPSDQEIHPYFFGEPELKRTCLWLKNLPRLNYQLKDDLFALKTATNKPEPLSIDATPAHHKRYFTDSKIRDTFLRARTFQGIANAMANQWG